MDKKHPRSDINGTNYKPQVETYTNMGHVITSQKMLSSHGIRRMTRVWMRRVLRWSWKHLFIMYVVLFSSRIVIVIQY